MEGQREITDLPVEVLDLIYKFLRLEPDKLNLAQTNRYLRQVFAFHSRHDFKIIPKGHFLPLDTWRIVLPLCGSNVYEFRECIYEASSPELKELVVLHCPNLERINLRISSESVDSVIPFLWKIKDKLRSVHLGYASDYSTKIYPKLLKDIPEMSLLRVLRIENISIDEVFHFQKFINLEELDFTVRKAFVPKIPMPSYPTANIFSIFEPFKKLRSLSVLGVTVASEDTDSINPILTLEELKLVDCYITMDFPTCPKLKSMTLMQNRMYDSEGSVRRSILNQGETLERLVFNRPYTQYDNQGFLELLRGCRRLRYLKLAVGDVKFYLHVVREIVDILRKNGLDANDPLELTVDQNYKFKCLRHWVSSKDSLKAKRRLIFKTW
ncbi:hypothetical protein KR038_011507, partial [Drosophila bunnanda]